MKALLSLGISLLLNLCCLAQELPVLFKDVIPGAIGHYADIKAAMEGNYFLVTKDSFYFYSIERSNNIIFWKSDGTAEGTYPLIEAKYTYKVDSAIRLQGGKHITAAAVGKTVYFVWSDDAHGVELWKTDGTAASTALFRDLNEGKASSAPANLVALKQKLIFTTHAKVVESGFSRNTVLWQTDGTAAGTEKLKEI